jgi:hypothetical protein
VRAGVCRAETATIGGPATRTLTRCGHDENQTYLPPFVPTITTHPLATAMRDGDDHIMGIITPRIGRLR